MKRRSITHRGVTFTTSGHRRFVTFVKHPDQAQPLIVQRTDNVQTARLNNSSVQRRFMGSRVVTIDFVGQRIYSPGSGAVRAGVAWIEPEPEGSVAAFPTIPGRPTNPGESEDAYIERTTFENNVTESTYPRHGSME